jgi:hypothetical protein
MRADAIYFDRIKETGGWYYVEYLPPLPSIPFATLSLVIPGEADPARVAEAMETELSTWLTRYPIPLMVSSFDAADSLLRLSSVRECDHVMGWIDPTTRQAQSRWRLVGDHEIPSLPMSSDFLKRVYSNISFRTSADLATAAESNARSARLGWWIVFVWAAVVPAVVAIVEWASPSWVAVIILTYSLYKAFAKAMQLLGKWRPSAAEQLEQEEQRAMRHHHYHCKTNPKGFLRLKAENFEREARERTSRDAESLGL